MEAVFAYRHPRLGGSLLTETANRTRRRARFPSSKQTVRRLPGNDSRVRLKMEQPGQTNYDEVNRNNVVQQTWH